MATQHAQNIISSVSPMKNKGVKAKSPTGADPSQSPNRIAKQSDNNDNIRNGSSNNHTHSTNYQSQQNQQPSQNDSSKILLILEQLISLLNLTIKTSSKVLTPALYNMISKVSPTLVRLMEQMTPTRIKHWSHLIYISYANAFDLLLHSTQGQNLMYNAHSIFDQFMNLVTCVNSRQVLIDYMTFNIKLLNLFASPEFKAILSSIPILTIRIIDTVSSGEAKLFCHSIGTFYSSMIDFFNQEDMILLFAEVTAKVVNALEMENTHYLPTRRKIQRRKRKISIATTTGDDENETLTMMRRKRKSKRNNNDSQKKKSNYLPSYSVSVAAMEAKRRQARNRFIKETYNQRVLLHDDEYYNVKNEDNDYYDHEIYGNGPNDRHVEDAILSSLSQDHSTYADDAWLTRLGRKHGPNDKQDNELTPKMGQHDHDDAPSLPSKVILNTNNTDFDDDDSNHDNNNFSVDSSLHLDDLDLQSDHDSNGRDDEHQYVDVVDTTYLRSGIEKRNSDRLPENRPSDNARNTNDGDSFDTFQSPLLHVEEEGNNNHTDIEDLLQSNLNKANDDVKQNSQQTTATHNNTKSSMKKMTLTLSQEDGQQRITLGEGPNTKIREKVTRSNINIRGAESSVAQFCRALDDIATTIRNENISNILQETNKELDRDKSKKRQGAKWYPNAAVAVGAGNERGQDTMSYWGVQPTRFRANIGVGKDHNIISRDEENIEASQSLWRVFLRLGSSQITQTQKIILVLFLSLYIFISIVWFAFGCYGIYRWFFNDSKQGISNLTSSVPINEYVIRIIQDSTSQQEGLIDSVVNAVGDTAKAGKSNFIDNIITTLEDQEL